MVKLCCRCHVLLPEEEFSRHRTNRDGLQARCKLCSRAGVREWARNHPEKRREAARKDYKRHGRRPTKDCSIDKRRAQKAVFRAIEAGILIRPTVCHSCRETGFKIHAHHDDYSRPLDVRWLCTRCHGTLHAKIASGMTMVGII